MKANKRIIEMPYQQTYQNKVTLALDIGADCTISELLQFMETYNAEIFDFQAVGSAGGNPFITFSFKNPADCLMFKATWQTGFCNPVSIVQSLTPDIRAQLNDVNSKKGE